MNLGGRFKRPLPAAAKMDKLDLTDVTIKKKPNIYLV
jgi:hypothetical protein